MYDQETVAFFQGWRVYLNELYNANNKAARRYNYRSKLLKFLIIVFQGLSAALAVGGISNNNVAQVLLYIIIVFNSLTMLLNGIEEKLSWSKVANMYERQASGYLRVILMIEKQLLIAKMEKELL